jgi:hypothetical protein
MIQVKTADARSVQQPQQQPKKDNVTRRVRVPLSVIGKVIGQGGASVKEIQAKSGCNITQDKKQAEPAADRIFLLQGRADAVAEAERLVMLKVNQSLQSMSARQGSPPGTPTAGGDGAAAPKATSAKKKKRVKVARASSLDTSVTGLLPLPAGRANVARSGSLGPVPGLLPMPTAVAGAGPPPSPKRFSASAYTNAPPPGMLPLPMPAQASPLARAKAL